MIRLSDYLNYLNNEIIQARKKADENAVMIAKEYAKHEYLKFFKVPRYSLPNVKMDIPIKITDIDADADRNFKLNENKFIQEVNERILLVNRQKLLNIQPVSVKNIQNEDFKILLNGIRSGGTASSARAVTINTTQVPEVKIPGKTLPINSQRPVERPIEGTSTETESEALKGIYADVLNKYSLMNSKLNNIYIDPNTNSAEDKDKLFINLHVEMEEEGIRIVTMKDQNGREVEQIIFE
ncbi:hypothetical protein FY557_16495 [Chryseobacterium sp. SN22]|uniref:hypothetical protein n=1 Tax=Chryseobacterium sp. SN22 TaxID=2606431 RepID=UPI0011EC7BC7|nr:hypothetical protein [Chryseobacterium sp. SN22]KAA0126637.1 hypothetical protein FY557_16495 [Chryseobacterium sp. SN22]